MSAESETRAPTGFTERGFSDLDRPSEAIANTCIKCGFCLPTCPTYAITQDERSSPRGRINLIKEVLDGRLPLDDPTFRYQMGECLGCRNCEPVCPSGVAFGALLENARAQIAQADQSAAGALSRTALDLLLGNLWLLRLVVRLLQLYQRLGLQRALRRTGLLRSLGLDRLDSLVPDLRGEPFAADGATWLGLGQAAAYRGKVAIFTGCVMGAAFGDVHRATVRVLTANGWSVEATAGQGCCGALHVHAGYKEAGRRFARQTIAAFEKSAAAFVAVNAAGCGALMKEYDRLLASDEAWAARARAFVERVRDVSELLVQPLPDSSALGELRTRVTYQDPCHLAHAQGVRSQPRALIDAIPGVERVEMPEADRCCGSAGMYNVTHPAMASELLARKLDAAASVGAERIITANPGCHLQLAAGARHRGGPRVQHLMELLDESFQAKSVTRITAGERLRNDRSKGLLLIAGGFLAACALVFVLRRLR